MPPAKVALRRLIGNTLNMEQFPHAGVGFYSDNDFLTSRPMMNIFLGDPPVCTYKPVFGGMH